MSSKPPTKFSLMSFLKLTRFGNILMIGIAQYITAIFLIGPKENWQLYLRDLSLLLIVISTFLITAAGYIINDYYDIKIDLINKPHRVTIGNQLSRRAAIFTHASFNLIGAVLGMLVSWKIAAINLTVGFLLWLYSNSLKRLPLIGNLVVSILTALSIFIIAIYYKTNIPLIATYALFAFFISLIREIIKDMEDMQGDAAFGCKTLPIVYGIPKTKGIIYILVTIFTLILVVLGGLINPNLITYFAIFIFIPLAFLIIKLSKSQTSKDYRFLSTLCKFIMLGGIVSMVFI